MMADDYLGDERIARLKEEIDKLSAENERLRALLRDLEWFDEPEHCPSCGRCRHGGHAPDCALRAALEGK